ncbi:MAG: hypothetical protein NVSMB17_11040 [Candidatus Dormibacteria bacterium]
MRRHFGRGALTIAMVAFAVAGCGGQADVLGQASSNLGNVRSGNLDLRMAVGAGDAASEVGFEEKGPFSLPNAGSIPVARTEVTHFVGDKHEASTFIATGRNVYIDSAGEVYQLPPAMVEQLRRANSGAGDLAGLKIERWATGARSSDGGQVDGVASDRVTGAVNVRQFVNDMMQLSRGLGQTASVPQVSPAEADTLARAVKASHFELWAGRDDHLLRRLVVTVEFAAPAAAQGSEALGHYSQSRMALNISLSNVNHPVTVADPPGARPFSDYCKKQPDAPSCANPTS